MHSNHFGIYRTFHQWRGFCSHSTRIERDSGVFLRWYHVMSTCKANTLKGCCHWSCSSHVCNDHIFFQQHWPCIGTYTVQSKTEKRSFTEVTVVTTRLKGTVVTIFSKNLKIKKLFPTNRLLKFFRSWNVYVETENTLWLLLPMTFWISWVIWRERKKSLCRKYHFPRS